MITPAELQQLMNARPAAPVKPVSDVPRAAYWREYHAHRQAADPAYRARKIEAALKHKAALKRKATTKNKANHG